MLSVKQQQKFTSRFVLNIFSTLLTLCCFSVLDEICHVKETHNLLNNAGQEAGHVYPLNLQTSFLTHFLH
jgi:hypothetical protein